MVPKSLELVRVICNLVHNNAVQLFLLLTVRNFVLRNSSYVLNCTQLPVFVSMFQQVCCIMHFNAVMKARNLSALVSGFKIRLRVGGDGIFYEMTLKCVTGRREWHWCLVICQFH